MRKRKRKRSSSRSFDRKALLQDNERERQKRAAAKLRAQKARIAAERKLYPARRTEAAASCSSAKESAKANATRIRAEARQAVEDEKAAAWVTCAIGRKARGRKLASLGEEHRAAARLERQVRTGNKGKAARPGVRRASARERRGESDGEVRANIPPELAGMWNRVKGGIQGNARKTRTEAFLEYAESHQGERFASADDETEQMIREHERQLRGGRRARSVSRRR